MTAGIRFTVSFLVALILAGSALAQSDVADVAAKAAQIEALRSRLAMVSSPTASTSLIEAESLLRQLRAAPPGRREALRSQLEAALARIEMEIDAAGPWRP